MFIKLSYSYVNNENQFLIRIQINFLNKNMNGKNKSHLSENGRHRFRYQAK